jgi:hypothetical protein
MRSLAAGARGALLQGGDVPVANSTILMLLRGLSRQVRGAHYYKAQTFPELVRRAVGPAFGRVASTVLGFALTFFVFGSLVAYQVVAGACERGLGRARANARGGAGEGLHRAWLRARWWRCV